jgi:hypothetical protein
MVSGRERRSIGESIAQRSRRGIEIGRPFVGWHGQRRHFSTKARAKFERDKARAPFTQEGKLAAGMDEQHRRDAVQAVNLLPVGWTLTRCVQFVADHVKRATQVLSIEETLDRFLTAKEDQEDLSLLLGGIDLMRTRRKNRHRKEAELSEKI